MEKRVGNNAVKIACLQTVPGKEFDVAKLLQEGCKGQGLEPPMLLKGLGSFDIIMFYRTPNFGPQLTKAGPISGILKSNLFLTFPYIHNSSCELFDSLDSKVFTVISFLKIHPRYQRASADIKIHLEDILSKFKNEGYILGSIGWNEFIVVLCGNNLESLCKEALSLSRCSLSVTSGTSPDGLFLKTHSYPSINYNWLNFSTELLNDYLTLEKHFNDFEELKSPISSDMTVSVSISSAPMFFKKIKEYWDSAAFDVKNVLGLEDLEVFPLEKITWGQLISRVLHFRNIFSEEIQGTNTSIRTTTLDKDLLKCGGRIDGLIIKPDESFQKVVPVNMSYEKIEELFGSQVSPMLSSHLNEFSNLIQNPISGNVYADIARYPLVIKDVIDSYERKIQEIEDKKLKEVARSSFRLESHAVLFCEILKRGAELRSYGTYKDMEEVYGRFSKLKGGGQRSFRALKYLPNKILLSCNVKWNGFIITECEKFAHFFDVIMVPTDALWTPKNWWPLYHEVAHVLIDNGKNLLDETKEPAIAIFLSNKDNLGYWRKMLVELTAEVIGFELGFFGDYNLFLKLLWDHLKRISTLKVDSISFVPYLVRGFYVYLFEEIYRTKKIAPEIMKDQDSLYELFLAHIDHISVLSGINFDERHFIVGNNVSAFMELAPFSEYLYGLLEDMQRNFGCLYNHEKFLPEEGKDNTTEILNTVKEGFVWKGNIDFPEALLYRLFQHDDVSFRQDIATVLTFANNYIEQ